MKIQQSPHHNVEHFYKLIPTFDIIWTHFQIWRNKKLISRSLKLGRLESSEEFKEKKSEKKKTEEVEIEKLKITVRNLTKDDIDDRKVIMASFVKLLK